MITYQFRSFEDIDIDLWKHLQDNSSLCDVLQTLEWAKVLKNSSKHALGFLVLLSNMEPIGGCIASLPKIPFTRFSAVEIIGGPLHLPGYEDESIKRLIDYLKRSRGNVIHKLFKPSPLLNAKFKKLFVNKGFRISEDYTFLTDLSGTESQLWVRLDKQARWGVKKAQRSGVKVMQADSRHDWYVFYDLYRRHCLTHRYTSLLPETLFQRIYEILYPQKIAKLFLAQLDDRVIAGTLLLIHRKYVTYFRNASLDEYLRYEPNNILQWESFKWARENGAEIYDMGGILIPSSRVSPLYGLYKYKEKWGGKLIEYNSYCLENVLGAVGRSLYQTSVGIRVYNALKKALLKR